MAALQMRYVSVNVRRSELLDIQTHVPAWEIPLLQAVHGAENVVINDEMEAPNPWPGDAAMEFDRLEQRYKAPEGAPPYVHQVYGVSVGGQQALARAIAQAYQEAKANPIDYAAQAKAKSVKVAPKVAIDYGDDAPAMTLGDALTDEQLEQLDPSAKLYSPTTGALLTD